MTPEQRQDVVGAIVSLIVEADQTHSAQYAAECARAALDSARALEILLSLGLS